MEEMSRGHVILILCDHTGDHLIMSGDVPRGLEIDLSVMDMTLCLLLPLVHTSTHYCSVTCSACLVSQKPLQSPKRFTCLFIAASTASSTLCLASSALHLLTLSVKPSLWAQGVCLRAQVRRRSMSMMTKDARILNANATKFEVPLHASERDE